jgi:GNAT superfamily N-acetyltransferase
MISIQRARPEQAAELSEIAFAAKAYWGYPPRWLAMWKPQLTFQPDYFTTYESWVASVEGTPVGFYTLEARKGAAWLENLWVTPAYIGKGAGTALFQHAVQLARQRGFQTLQLEADPNAVGFYEKMGMVRIGERRYEIEGEQRVLPTMALRL